MTLFRNLDNIQAYDPIRRPFSMEERNTGCQINSLPHILLWQYIFRFCSYFLEATDFIVQENCTASLNSSMPRLVKV